MLSWHKLQQHLQRHTVPAAANEAATLPSRQPLEAGILLVVGMRHSPVKEKMDGDGVSGQRVPSSFFGKLAVLSGFHETTTSPHGKLRIIHAGMTRKWRGGRHTIGRKDLDQ